jgi:hypothetical protein
MRQNIVEAAGKFAAEHFTDVQLSQQQFSTLICEALTRYPVLEDKLDFVSEVIRLGRLFLSQSQFVLHRIEAGHLSDASV